MALLFYCLYLSPVSVPLYTSLFKIAQESVSHAHLIVQMFVLVI
jgi:hypothetical protein